MKLDGLKFFEAIDTQINNMKKDYDKQLELLRKEYDPQFDHLFLR